MATRQTPQTRARDIDRVNTCARLDAAYTDGQLTASEHREFVAAAQTAKTLRELADLVRDLQPPETGETAPLTAEAPRGRRGRKVAGIGAAVAVAIGVAVTVASGGNAPEPQPAEVAAAPAAAEPGEVAAAPAPTEPVEPIVVAPVRPLGPGGFQRIVDTYRAEFGDTLAYEVALYPTWAAADRAVPDAPDRIASYRFEGGWLRSGTSTSSRFPGYGDFDAALVDTAALEDLISRAPGLLGAPDGSVTHVLLRDDGTATINIYVDYGRDRGNGYLKAAFDGTVLREYR